MIAADASTIILLAKATILSKFFDSTGGVSITPEVQKELKGKESFDALIINKEIENGRIVVEAVDVKKHSQMLNQFRLDEGEASILALCIDRKGKGILTDDKELIKACKIREIGFVTALTVAVMLFRSGKLEREEALEKIEKLQGYGRYSSDVYNYFKGMVMENGNNIDKDKKAKGA